MEPLTGDGPFKYNEVFASDAPLFLYGSIDRAMALKVQKFILRLQDRTKVYRYPVKDPAEKGWPARLEPAWRGILVFLNSDGGEDEQGWAIYDMLRKYPGVVTILGQGQVESMALVILQAASPGFRLLDANTQLLMHYGSAAEPANPTSTVVKAMARQQDAMDERYVRTLSDHAKKNCDFKQYCLEETYFDAQQAVNLSLADRVVSPTERFPITCPR